MVSRSRKIVLFSQTPKPSTEVEAFDTLVLYTFSDSDPEYRQNLQYFIQYGLGTSNVEFVFIVQQVLFCFHILSLACTLKIV